MTLTATFESTETTRTLKELFWRRGYEHTSIEDVVQATGMNRYALYNAFGGKRELFLAALDDYYFERRAKFLRAFDAPEGEPLDAIRSVMEFAIRELAERGAGCLMCNVANDLGPSDPVIAARVETYLNEIQFAFREALSRAGKRGTLNKNIAPEDGANMLITIMLGNGVRAKAGSDHTHLLRIVDTALKALSR